jgi:hypothetical protein
VEIFRSRARSRKQRSRGQKNFEEPDQWQGTTAREWRAWCSVS